MCLPKTEKELEIFFKLLELYEAKKQSELPYTMVTPLGVERNINQYNYMKKDYLNLVNA